MGAGLSLPKERDTPGMLNFILQEMFRKADLADIYSLSDPERCKRYIIVGERALDELFLKVNLFPEKGEDGKLFFQSLDGFKSSMPAPLREKQTAYCKELSFFFVRIFQTFGALYLSIYDSRIPLTDPVEQVKTPGRYGQVPFQNPGNFYGYDLQPKEDIPWYKRKIFSGGDFRRGSSFYIENSPYSILNPYLTVARDAGENAPLKFEHNPLFIIQKTLYDFNAGTRTVKDNVTPTILYTFERRNETIELFAILNITVNDSDVYRVTLSQFRGGNKWPINVIPIQDTYEETLKSSSYLQDFRSNTNKTLPQVLKKGFDEAILKMLGAPELSVVTFLKKFGYLSGSSYENQNIRGTNVYILKDQENRDVVNIVYSSKLQLEENGKSRQITVKISAKLKIVRANERDQFVQDTVEKYRVTLLFKESRVEPSELSSMLDIPDEKFNMFISEGGRAPRSDNQRDTTIPDYIEYIFKRIIGHPDATKSNTKGFQRTREGLVKPYNSERITPGLKVKDLWSAMAKDPPVKSYCIARAVQLLSVNAINNNFSKHAFTSVCKLSFPYQKDGSLPTPGKPITQASGIYALTLLFFDTLRGGGTQILDRESYDAYRLYLKNLFESESGETANTNIPRSVGDIKQTQLAMCKGRDDIMPVSEPLARDLRGVTDQLIQQQKDHFSKAITLIFRLFDQNSIERDRKLKFSRDILRGGMNEVERVANEARELLKDYYKGCETTYREGVKMIYEDPTLNPTTGSR